MNFCLSKFVCDREGVNGRAATRSEKGKAVMAKAILTSSANVAPSTAGRPRTSSILAGLAFVFLSAVGVLGVDWAEGPAMVVGELIGILAPVAFFALAGLIIYRLYRRGATN